MGTKPFQVPSQGMEKLCQLQGKSLWPWAEKAAHGEGPGGKLRGSLNFLKFLISKYFKTFLLEFCIDKQ